MQLPTKQDECLLRAFGTSIDVLTAFISFLSMSRMSKSLRSLLNLPPNIWIFPSYTVEVWPHLVRKEDPVGLRQTQDKFSNSYPRNRGAKSSEYTSLRHRYLPWHPPITKKLFPIKADEWNLLAQGLILDLSMGTSVQLKLRKLKIQRSSRSATPSPPKTTK